MAPLEPFLPPLPTRPPSFDRQGSSALAPGVLIAVTGWVAHAGGLYTYDDAFITHRMAANLASRPASTTRASGTWAAPPRSTA